MSRELVGYIETATPVLTGTIEPKTLEIHAQIIGIGPKGDTGPQGPEGPIGKSLEFLWEGTRLGIRVQGQPDYQFVDLKGEKGEQGIQGPKGDTGDKGDKGDIGPEGPQGPQGNGLEFVWDGTRLGVRVEGQAEYQYVDLQGPQGPKGDKGEQGAEGPIGEKGDPPAHEWSGTMLRFQAPDGTWGPYIDLRGPEGPVGPGAGDMLKSIYDKDDDGTVDSADVAASVPWSGITNIPGTFPPSSHSHDEYETPEGAQAKVDAHAAETNVHGATSAATADRIMIRDAAGRAKVAAPAAADDIARKDTVDAKFHETTGHKHTGAAGDGPKIPLASLATPILELVAEFEHNSTTQNLTPVAYLVESNALLGEFYIINCYLHEDSTGAGANLYYSAFEASSGDFSYACLWRKESEPGALYCGVAKCGTGRLHVTVQIARMVLPT